MHTPVPFKTQDAILAFCLYVAGVPEWCNPTNIYDADVLKRLGYRGLTLEEAAAAAWNKKQRGIVEYWFERTPELPHFLKFYEEQQAQIKAEGNDIDAGTAMRQVMAKAAASEIDEREALLRFFCVALKLRIPFVARCWNPKSAFIRIQYSGAPQACGPNATRYPGFKLIPLNASKDLKRKMKV